MKQEQNSQLTAAEIGSLWNQYLNDSMALCILKLFLKDVEDPEIRPILEYAQKLSETHLQFINHLFNQENIPLPLGFTDEDLDLTAPRLYSDPFFLSYLRNLGRIGLQRYGLALTTTARVDVRNFYKECIYSYIQLDEKATYIEMSKGLYVRSPYIPQPEKTEIIQSSGFMGSLFGKQRPLLAMEIDHIFVNAQSNGVGKALLMGFSQVAQASQICEFFLRGKQISHKHMEIFKTLLAADDLPSPMSIESYVTGSTISPFSDRLMLYHAMTLNAAGIGNYGVSLSVSMRTDIVAAYGRLMAEIAQYVEDGVHLSIKNRWMELPPQAVDRKALALKR